MSSKDVLPFSVKAEDLSENTVQRDVWNRISGRDTAKKGEKSVRIALSHGCRSKWQAHFDVPSLDLYERAKMSPKMGHQVSRCGAGDPLKSVFRGFFRKFPPSPGLSFPNVLGSSTQEKKVSLKELGGEEPVDDGPS